MVHNHDFDIFLCFFLKNNFIDIYRLNFTQLIFFILGLKLSLSSLFNFIIIELDFIIIRDIIENLIFFIFFI